MLPPDERLLKQQLEAAQAQLAPLEERWQAVQRRLQRRSTALKWGGLGVLGGHWALFCRLTYWELSWDVMVSGGGRTAGRGGCEGSRPRGRAVVYVGPAHVMQQGQHGTGTKLEEHRMLQSHRLKVPHPPTSHTTPTTQMPPHPCNNTHTPKRRSLWPSWPPPFTPS